MSEEKRIYVVVAAQHLSIKNGFFDTNKEAYYSPDPVLTAICTHPIHPAAVDGILDHLPLWSPK